MIKRFSKTSWVRVGRSGRRKRIFPENLILVFSGTVIILIITLWGLSNYTSWVLHREYDPDQDKMVKGWLPPLKSHFLEKLPIDLAVNYAAIINVLFASEPSETSPLPTKRIWVESNGLEKLNSGIFQYGLGFIEKKPFIQGFYQVPNAPSIPIKISLRGVMPYHHMIWKPSLRIKFNKGTLVDGFQNHLFIAPEDSLGLRNWLSNELGKKWGFMDNGDHFVRIFINNKYMGLYNQLWRYDESLFIKSNIIPGPIFRLEHIDKREFSRVWVNWHNINGWSVIQSKPEDKKTEFTEEADYGKVELRRILGLNLKILKWEELGYFSTANNGVLELNQYLDREKFAKYLAILCHGGETHVDNAHNNSFWLDPASGKFFPILEDINGYDFPDRKNQLRRSIIKREGAFALNWQTNPQNLALFIDRLNELILGFGSEENMEHLIRQKWEEIKPSAISDINMSDSVHPRKLMPITGLEENVESLIGFIKKRNLFIKNQIYGDKIYLLNLTNSGFNILVQGFSGVIAKNEFLNSFTELLPSIIRKPVSKVELKPYIIHHFEGRPKNYTFTHRLTKKTVNFTALTPAITLLRNKYIAESRTHSNKIPQPNIALISLGPGEVTINKTREYNEGQPVRIRAGTQLKLGAGVSLIVRGPLHIEGTFDQPVTVRPMNPEQPFGVLALLGKQTKGSWIRHLDMEGGSIHRHFNLKLSGMLSVHDCPDIEIRNSRFGKNFFGDDAVHIIQSKVQISNSRFENAFEDAMDWDKVDGQIFKSVFLNPGGDGLDSSMGKVHVVQSRFELCGDRCISAGEGVLVKISGSNFLNCNIGVGVQNRSQMELSDSLISGCEIGYNAIRKKWRWGKGGNGVLKNTRFLNSIEADVAGDEYSRVFFPKGLPENLIANGNIKIISPLNQK